jgi:hypothetical protein
MTIPMQCNACDKRPVFSISPQPVAQLTLSHVPNQCDANSIVIAQEVSDDYDEAKEEFAKRWNAIMEKK